LQCLVNNEQIQISDIKVSNLVFSSYNLPFKVNNPFLKSQRKFNFFCDLKLSENRKLVENTPKNMIIEDGSKLYLLEINKDSGSLQLVKTIDDVIIFIFIFIIIKIFNYFF
jgi:hypothetical protein